MKGETKMIQRMIGAAMLNASVFEEIEADRGALPQAIGIVILVTICGIAGGIIGNVIDGEGQSAGAIGFGVLNGALFGLIRWALWVTLLLLVGGVMLRTSGTQTNWAELGRVVGFAYTPGVLSLLSFAPGAIGFLFPIIAFFWTLSAVVVAIRHALDYEGTGRAILVAAISGVIGFIPWLILKIVEWIIT